jgi:rhamnose utilization protein RhaD (predicted bifunctional aldolase and dehydrogenase)
MTTEAYELPAMQTLVDNALKLAENWIRADADRRAAKTAPSDHEPEGADLAAYLRGAFAEYARAAIQQERAKWVLSEMELADALGYPGPDSSGLSLLEFAAAIRAG